jgi:hypothetical protein
MLMILLTAIRFVRAVYLEAAKLQREAIKRFPHLRQD